VVEEARALTIYWDGTTQDGVDEKMPNPRYLFRSTDNECEAVMSSLLAIKYWKGKFVTVAGINPDYSYGRNNMAAFVAMLKRFNIEHKVITEQWPKIGTMDLTSHVAALKAAKPDLIFSSLLFADLPVFMKQAHAAGLTEGTKLVFAAAGRRRTTSSTHWSACRSKAWAARVPGARTTSRIRPLCRASPLTRTSTTSSRSGRSTAGIPPDCRSRRGRISGSGSRPRSSTSDPTNWIECPPLQTSSPAACFTPPFCSWWPPGFNLCSACRRSSIWRAARSTRSAPISASP